MHLRYIYHGKEKEKHPFYVKSNWVPPVQLSVTLETYLEEIKLQLAEIEITHPKKTLSQPERQAIKALRENSKINIKKAFKGTTTVIMNKEEKINEGLMQLNVKENYKPLETPLVGETYNRVKQLISELHQKHHIDQMTFKWFSNTKPPFYSSVLYTGQT